MMGEDGKFMFIDWRGGGWEVIVTFICKIIVLRFNFVANNVGLQY
jgi:hypothetical protein